MIKRMLWAVPTLLGVMLLLFSLTYLLPGDPATIMLGPRATPEKIAKLNARLNLDKPIHIRLTSFISGALGGDLGQSVWSGHPVKDLIKKNLPHTILLAVTSLGIAALMGIGIGAFAATLKGRWFDKYITGSALIAVAVPDFVLALILLLVFCIQFPWFPAIGGGEDGGLLHILHHLILPASAMAMGWIGFFIRLSRESMLEVLDSDHI
ncbi:MAG: ABC transporter permease, partial [Desulfobacterales bacterium]|nr:ABC transporter permease [Desulfobacterales bacterium]